MMDGNTIVRLWFTIGGLFVVLVMVILGAVELHKYQEGEQMEACVKAGKVWKVERITSPKNTPSDNRVCVNP